MKKKILDHKKKNYMHLKQGKMIYKNKISRELSNC